MLYISHLKGLFEEEDVRCLIRRRRLQLLVHSYLYYATDTQLVTDSMWDTWAKELVKLQRKYPYVCKFLEYHEDFIGFDGTTGFYLPWNDDQIRKIGDNLVNYSRQRKATRDNRQCSKVLKKGHTRSTGSVSKRRHKPRR